MARLRREEEERSYERMLRKTPARESFAERFPLAPMAHAFAEVNKSSKKSDMGDEDIEFGDVQRQVTLIINFLLSVFGCGAALWKLAQWWPVSTRLFLSLGGALLVGITEVAVYSAYTWRMSQGEKKQTKMKEVQEIVQTWVVGDDGDGDDRAGNTDKGKENDDRTRAKEPTLLVEEDSHKSDTSLRKRIKTEK